MMLKTDGNGLEYPVYSSEHGFTRKEVIAHSTGGRGSNYTPPKKKRKKHR